MQIPDQADRPYRRRVFYIPGYDPFPPRRYRELYRKECQLQASHSGYHIEQKPKKKGDSHGWCVDAQIEGRAVHSDIEVLLWSDIVRASMPKSIWVSYWRFWRTVWLYVSSGAFGAMIRLRKGPMIAGLYPAIFLFLQLILALGLGWVSGRVTAYYSHWAIGILCGAGVVWAILAWFRAKDRKIFAWYLMHDYSYSGQENGITPASLHHRMREFSARIRQAMDEDYDEVLVIGHSSGAHIGVMVLASLLREGGLADKAPTLSFLSLGEVVPMVAFLPKGDELRQDLYTLSRQNQIFWLDVTAPGDGCCFALCDPVAISGMHSPEQVGPLVLSAAFSQTLQPHTWKKQRWRWFRLHFQYLCAFDGLSGKADEYDYFKITAGPLSLQQRFGQRKPSKSVVRRSVNPYGATKNAN